MAETPFDKVRLAEAIMERSVQEFRSGAGHGSDDEYCSAYPSEPRHHYISHSVDAGPIRFVDRCQLCGHISSRSLRRQLERAENQQAEPRVIF